MEVLRSRYSIPFASPPPLSQVPVPFDSYSPSSTKGVALKGEISALIEKGAIALAPPSLGFYSRVFVVMKASGLWRPIIDLSIFNKFALLSWFKMETNQSVLNVIQRDDCMFSIDLKDAYLQVPVHPESKKLTLLRSIQQGFNSRSCVSASPRLPRCLPGSWLLYWPFYTV